MMKIHKYKVLPSFEIQTLNEPGIHSIVSAAEQNGEVVLYARIEQNYHSKQKKFMVIGTGWEVDVSKEYSLHFVNTVKTGGFVWHVFEAQPWEELPF